MEIKLYIDLYKSADQFGKGSIGRALDLATLLKVPYYSGVWNGPFEIDLSDCKEDPSLICSLIKDAGLVVMNPDILGSLVTKRFVSMLLERK